MYNSVYRLDRYTYMYMYNTVYIYDSVYKHICTVCMYTYTCTTVYM